MNISECLSQRIRPGIGNGMEKSCCFHYKLQIIYNHNKYMKRENKKGWEKEGTTKSPTSISHTSHCCSASKCSKSLLNIYKTRQK